MRYLIVERLVYLSTVLGCTKKEEAKAELCKACDDMKCFAD